MRTQRSEKNLKALEKLQSWTATAHFVSTAWRAGSVPKAYTTDALDLAGEQVREKSGQFRQAPLLPSELRPQLPGHVERIEYIITRLAGAVKRGDKDAAAQEEQQLAVEQQVLASLRSRTRASP